MIRIAATLGSSQKSYRVRGLLCRRMRRLSKYLTTVSRRPKRLFSRRPRREFSDFASRRGTRWPLQRRRNIVQIRHRWLLLGPLLQRMAVPLHSGLQARGSFMFLRHCVFTKRRLRPTKHLTFDRIPKCRGIERSTADTYYTLEAPCSPVHRSPTVDTELRSHAFPRTCFIFESSKLPTYFFDISVVKIGRDSKSRPCPQLAKSAMAHRGMDWISNSPIPNLTTGTSPFMDIITQHIPPTCSLFIYYF